MNENEKQIERRAPGIEANKHAWMRLGVFIFALAASVWGAGATFSSTNDRTIRNENDIAENSKNDSEHRIENKSELQIIAAKSEAEIQKIRERNENEHRVMREKHHELEIMNNTFQMGQNQIYTRLDVMEDHQQDQHKEVMNILNSWNTSTR